MSSKNAVAAVVIVLLCCGRALPDWYVHQDHTIKMPAFDANTKIDMTIDGTTLEALRIAAEDFAPRVAEPRACAHTQAGYLYRVIRQGEIIFVAIDRDPEACGGQGYSLGGSARYAIGKDRRILRLVVDGDGTDTWPEDAGTWELLPDRPDGGPDFHLPSPCPVGPYAPLWLRDGGPVCEPEDAGVPDAGLHLPDAGVTWGSDAGAEAGADGGAAMISIAPAAKARPASSASDNPAQTSQRRQGKSRKNAVAPRPDAGGGY